MNAAIVAFCRQLLETLNTPSESDEETLALLEMQIQDRLAAEEGLPPTAEEVEAASINALNDMFPAGFRFR